MTRLIVIVASMIFGMMLGAASSVYPAPITIDFNDQPDGFRFDNFAIQGIRFSPQCPAHVTAPKPHFNYTGGNYLSADADNNCGALNNQKYLGGAFADIYLDRFGNDFTFLGIDGFDPHHGAMGFELVSSKGGVFQAVGNRSFVLSGDAWENVKWVTVRDTTLNGFHNHHGWDNLRIDYANAQALPEPGTAWLIGIAGLVAFSLGYKKFFKRTYER